MDKIKFSIFDIFAYIFPGLICFLALVVLLNTSVIKPIDSVSLFQNMNLSSALLLLIVSYILGFAIDTPGTLIYEFIAYRIWSQPSKDYININKDISNTEKRILVRQFSPENLSYIHLWKVIKTMSHNLAFGSVLVLGVSVIKFVQFKHYFHWGTIAILSFIFIFLFVHRAYIFDSWHYKELEYTVKTLCLKEKALKEFSNSH